MTRITTAMAIECCIILIENGATDVALDNLKDIAETLRSQHLAKSTPNSAYINQLIKEEFHGTNQSTNR